MSAILGSLPKIVFQNVDLVAADMSISAARDLVVDFTTPLLTNPAKILINSNIGLSDVQYLVERGSSFNRYSLRSKLP